MVTKVELFKIHNISLPRLENDLTPKKNPIASYSNLNGCGIKAANAFRFCPLKWAQVLNTFSRPHCEYTFELSWMLCFPGFFCVCVFFSSQPLWCFSDEKHQQIKVAQRSSAMLWYTNYHPDSSRDQRCIMTSMQSMVVSHPVWIFPELSASVWPGSDCVKKE